MYTLSYIFSIVNTFTISTQWKFYIEFKTFVWHRICARYWGGGIHASGACILPLTRKGYMHLAHDRFSHNRDLNLKCHFVKMRIIILSIFCKVEFNQPSCWLYSVPNLLVFLQLVTLYFGGNYVRVVCERVWRIAQVCAKKQGLAVGSREWLTVASRLNDAHVPSMSEVEASCQLLHYRKKVTS